MRGPCLNIPKHISHFFIDRVTVSWLQLFKKVLEKELQVYICLDI